MVYKLLYNTKYCTVPGIQLRCAAHHLSVIGIQALDGFERSWKADLGGEIFNDLCSTRLSTCATEYYEASYTLRWKPFSPDSPFAS